MSNYNDVYSSFRENHSFQHKFLNENSEKTTHKSSRRSRCKEVTKKSGLIKLVTITALFVLNQLNTVFSSTNPIPSPSHLHNHLNDSFYGGKIPLDFE